MGGCREPLEAKRDAMKKKPAIWARERLFNVGAEAQERRAALFLRSLPLRIFPRATVPVASSPVARRAPFSERLRDHVELFRGIFARRAKPDVSASLDAASTSSPRSNRESAGSHRPFNRRRMSGSLRVSHRDPPDLIEQFYYGAPRRRTCDTSINQRPFICGRSTGCRATT